VFKRRVLREIFCCERGTESNDLCSSPDVSGLMKMQEDEMGGGEDRVALRGREGCVWRSAGTRDLKYLCLDGRIILK
jgi:hypothetical protein